MPKKKKKKSKKGSEDEEIRRIRLPREGEVLGIVVQMLGYDRLRVKCSDGKTRMCRIPGRMKKRVWMREGDVLLIVPWEFQSDERGDIVHRYTMAQVRWLEENGYLDWGEEEEF